MTVMHARIKYAAIMILIIALAALTFVWPIRSKVISANLRLAKLQSELDQSDVTLQKIEFIQQQLIAVKQRQIDEMKLMPPSADLPGLIKDITRNVADLPLQGSNVNRSRDVSLNRDQSLGLVIQTEGEFAGVFELMRRIERLPRLIRINEITVKHEPTSDDDAAVTASIDISAFYRPQDVIHNKP